MKYVLVTGSYSGMGKAVVEKLLSQGYFVFGIDKFYSEPKNNYFPLTADVTDEDSLIDAFNKVKAITDELFAVLHFAGKYCLDSLVEISEIDFCRAFDVNVFGAYRINKIFFPLLKNGSKVIITTSELAPLAPLPFTGLYAITKSTLDKYAYSLRMELQLLGVQVVVLRLGAVKTEMLGASVRALDNFCDNTKIYTCNAKRFKKIVDRVESKNVPPTKIAKKTAKILEIKNPKYVYKINRNPLLLLLNCLPQRWQTWIIKRVLK